MVFENIFYNNTDNDFATAFDFDYNEENYTLKNVIINRAFIGNCKKPFSMRQKGSLVYSELYGKNVENKSGEIFGE